MKKETRIGIGHPSNTAKGFIDAWKSAEKGEKAETEQWLNFENLEMLLHVLTPRRWVLLKTLRKEGPLSIRALASLLKRDYKNVYSDVRRLEDIGLICRNQDDKVEVPWDIVEARLRLSA